MNFLDDNNRVENPVKVRLEWKSELGAFCFQKKKEGTEKEYETFEMKNITFVPIQLAHRIGGYSDHEQSGIYSNTITNLKEHRLSVRFAKNKSVIAEGVYAEIKEKAKAVGGKFQNVFFSVITHYNGKELHEKKFVEIIISGSSSVGVSNSNENIFGLVGKVVEQNGFTEEKKGANKYKAPIFKTTTLSRDTAPNYVIDFAKEVGAYLKDYLRSTQKVEETTAEVAQPQATTQTQYTNEPLKNIAVKGLNSDDTFVTDVFPIIDPNTPIGGTAGDDLPF